MTFRTWTVACLLSAHALLAGWIGWRTCPNRTEVAHMGAALPGWYAVSVNEVFWRSRQYRYFLRFEPVAMAGYSIYIYHITVDDANRVRREVGLPEVGENG